MFSLFAFEHESRWCLKGVAKVNPTEPPKPGPGRCGVPVNAHVLHVIQYVVQHLDAMLLIQDFFQKQNTQKDKFKWFV